MPLETEDPELQPAPDYTVLREGRLVAYVWRDEGGVLRRAGGHGATLAPVAYAEIRLFDRREEATVVELTKRATDLDGLLFALRVEGMDVVEGRVEPAAHLRRF